MPEKKRRYEIKKKVVIASLCADAVIVAVSACMWWFTARTEPVDSGGNSPQQAASVPTLQTVAPSKEPSGQPQKADQQESQTVWKAKTGDIYHTDPECYHIPKSAREMKFSDATAAGYRKCKDCKN